MKLTSEKFEIIQSRKSAVEKGEHYILQPKDISKEPTMEEKLEAIKLALILAEGSAFEPERYRISLNGKGERHGKNTHFHIHIILPKEDDELIRIVEKLIK